MKLIGPALGDDVDYTAGGVAELSAEVVGLDLIFLHHVYRGIDAGPVESGGGIAAAVHQELVLIRTRSVDRDKLIVVHVVSGLGEGSGSAHARHERGEAVGVAAVQGKLDQLFGFDYLGKRCRSRIEHGRLRADVHRLVDGAHLQDKIERGHLRHIQLDTRAADGAEAVFLNGQLVRGGIEGSARRSVRSRWSAPYV